jgi:hypothetical protein
MKYLKTPHEKKSAVITTLITVLLILLFFLLGLKYYDPPISFGMEVNFGNALTGHGQDITATTRCCQNHPTPDPKKSDSKGSAQEGSPTQSGHPREQ